MKLVDFYQSIIGLKGLSIHSVEHSETKIILHCSLERQSCDCPQCGEPSSILHQYKHRQVRDLSISGKQVWLHLRVAQLYCITCDSRFMQRVDWLLPGKSLSLIHI